MPPFDRLECPDDLDGANQLQTRRFCADQKVTDKNTIRLVEDCILTRNSIHKNKLSICSYEKFAFSAVPAVFALTATSAISPSLTSCGLTQLR